jgi:hypothetical protein
MESCAREKLTLIAKIVRLGGKEAKESVVVRGAEIVNVYN